MRRLILPDFMLGHFLVGWKCTGCGQPARGLSLRFPRVRLNDRHIVLNYPARCPCGERGCLKVVLPSLFFGYVVGRLLVLNADRNRSKIVVPVDAKRCDLFESLCRECEDDILQYAVDMTSGPSQVDAVPDQKGSDGTGRPGDHERLNFKLSPEEWEAFLRRLGFDEDEDDAERPF